MAATELSGFGLDDDMSDTLVVAISQSGTTTDTNRTVDLVRGRGATVLAIVNRRNSDLVDKSDGVLYTSDGRDLEMAVAVDQGVLRADRGRLPPRARAGRRVRRRSIPTGDARAARRPAGAARRDATKSLARARGDRRHRAPARSVAPLLDGRRQRAQQIAANELRIKLSELCYSSISSDIAEDKKHIDLCTEPLILVCAVGLEGSNADDVAKEVAYHRAHRAAPIVITTRGDDRFSSAVEIIEVPPVHPDLGLRALGDGRAPVRLRSRARHRRVGAAAARGARARSRKRRDRPATSAPSNADAHRSRRTVFLDCLRASSYDGNLDAATAVRSRRCCGTPSGSCRSTCTRSTTARSARPSVVVDDLTSALTAGIDELTRTIDTIKHQAKTVTVGISRADEELLQVASGARRCSPRAPPATC